MFPSRFPNPLVGQDIIGTEETRSLWRGDGSARDAHELISTRRYLDRRRGLDDPSLEGNASLRKLSLKRAE
jgi:hypothetical protein